MPKFQRNVSRIVSILKAGLPIIDAAEILVLRLLCFGLLVYELIHAFTLRR